MQVPKPDMVIYSLNSSAQESETGNLSEFKVALVYMVNSRLTKKICSHTNFYKI